MQVDGKEFLKNVNIEREKAKLEKEHQKLEESKVDAVKKEPDYFEPEDDAAYLDIAIDDKKVMQEDLNQLHDIRLDSGNNDDNKKKYIILGLALIILFIITIVIVRVVSNSEEEDKLAKQTPVVQEKPQKIKEDEKLEKIESPKEYKKVLEEEDFQKPTTPVVVPKQEKKDIILPEPVKEESPVVIEPKKPAAKPKDLFGLEPVKEKVKETVKKVEAKKLEPKKAQEVIERKAVQKVESKLPAPVKKVTDQPKRKIVVAPPKEKNFVKKATKVEGYYIQVGSFSKKPSDKYLNNIDKKGYNYTVHRMNIKGKYYNKVLIGPFPTRGTANGSLKEVRKTFKVPGAYILKF